MEVADDFTFEERETIVRLRRKGTPWADIAKELSRDHATVARYAMAHFPDIKPKCKDAWPQIRLLREKGLKWRKIGVLVGISDRTILDYVRREQKDWRHDNPGHAKLVERRLSGARFQIPNKPRCEDADAAFAEAVAGRKFSAREIKEPLYRQLPPMMSPGAQGEAMS